MTTTPALCSTCQHTHIRDDLCSRLVCDCRNYAAGPDPTSDTQVWVQLPAEDVAFLRGFDPDRDRTASRADMVRVIEHLQAALAVLRDDTTTALARVEAVAAELDARATRASELSNDHAFEYGIEITSRDAAAQIRAAITGEDQ